jgi:hypothetical protein
VFGGRVLWLWDGGSDFGVGMEIGIEFGSFAVGGFCDFDSFLDGRERDYIEV